MQSHTYSVHQCTCTTCYTIHAQTSRANYINRKTKKEKKNENRKTSKRQKTSIIICVGYHCYDSDSQFIICKAWNENSISRRLQLQSNLRCHFTLRKFIFFFESFTTFCIWTQFGRKYFRFYRTAKMNQINRSRSMRLLLAGADREQYYNKMYCSRSSTQ